VCAHARVNGCEYKRRGTENLKDLLSMTLSFLAILFQCE